MSYEPNLPFCGRGSPCGNLPLQRRYEELRAEDPRHPVPVFIDFADLADCRECGMCGACQVHGGCATDWNHIEWLAQFASPGEPACGVAGGPAGRTGHVCALPRHHLGHHLDWRGNGWPGQPARYLRRQRRGHDPDDPERPRAGHMQELRRQRYALTAWSRRCSPGKETSHV